MSRQSLSDKLLSNLDIGQSLNLIPKNTTNSKGSPLSTLSSDKDKPTSAKDPLSKIGFNPVQNELNSFNNATYHFKLSMISDSISDIKKANKVVLAESGATELNILSVRTSEVFSPNFKTKNTQWISFEIQLFEPMGTDFYNKLANAAKILQVQNIQKCFYNLELYFLGYDQDSGKPTIINGRKWNWPLTIVDISSQLDAYGSKHTLNMIVAFCAASTDTYNVISQGFKLDGTTLKDILGSLSTNMNQQIMDTYLFPMIKYKFEYLPYKNAGTTVNTPGDHIINLSNSTDVITRNPDGAHVAPGTTIEGLIDSLLSNSSSACELISPGRKTDSQPVDPNNKKPNCYYVTLKTDIKLGAYHSLYGDYEREITYTIVPFDVTRLYGNFSRTDDITDRNYNIKRLKYIIEKKYISKLYDYIFTGDNTEVLSFDIQSNFSYYAIQDHMYGMNHINSNTPGQTNNLNKASNNINDIQNELKKQQDALRKRVESKLLDNMSEQQLLNSQKNTLALKREQYKNDPNDSYAQNIIKQSQSEIDTLQQKITDNKNSILNSDEYKYYVQLEANSRKSIQDKLASQPSESYVDSYDASKLPNSFMSIPQISLRYDNFDKTKVEQFNIDSPPDNRRSMFMSMLQQLYEPTGSSLLSVALKVRGDPYWLGASFMGENYNSIDVANALEYNSISISGYPYTILNETTFVLRFNTPSGYDSANNVIIDKKNYYTGFYNCIQVDHIFDGGEFTQVLNGVLIPGTNYNDIVGSQNG